MNSRNIKIATLFFSQVVILVILLFSNEIVYVTHDDNVMVDIVSGGYGEVSEYLVNMHVLLGYCLKVLFKCFPVINWVSVFYLALYVLSFLVLDIVFSDKSRFWLNYTVLNTAFIMLVSHFSFTIVAYTCIIAGVISVVKSMDKEKVLNGYLWLGLVFVLLGGLVRGEAIKSVLILLCFYILCDWKNKKRHLCVIVIYFIMMVTCINSNLLIEKLDPVEKNFLDWGETRSSTLDCAAVPYDESAFNEKDISIEQYRFLYSAFYFDYEYISKETLESLASMNSPRNKYNFDVIGYWLQVKNSINKDNFHMFGSLHIVLFYTLLIIYIVLCIVCKNKEEWKAIVIWLACFSVGFVFYFIKRALYRVLMPNYVLGIVILLWMINKIKICFSGKKIKLVLGILCIALFGGVIWGRFNYNNVVRKDTYSPERQYVLDYMTDNNDIVYLAGDPGTFSVATARPIFEYTAQKGYWTLMGDWEIYSVPYYNLMKKYNIAMPDKLLVESVESNNVRYLTTKGDSFPEYNAYVLNHLKEEYGISAYFEKEIDIVTETNGTTWSVYRLKYEE